MATMVTKTVVCDEGFAKCDNSHLTRVRVAVDGKVVAQLLCAKHLAPFVELQQKMTGNTGRAGRAKIFTPDEIAARRKSARKR